MKIIIMVSTVDNVYIPLDRMILQFLIPVKLLLGIIPSTELLQQYKLIEYEDIVTSIKTGNLALFNSVCIAIYF